MSCTGEKTIILSCVRSLVCRLCVCSSLFLLGLPCCTSTIVLPTGGLFRNGGYARERTPFPSAFATGHKDFLLHVPTRRVAGSVRICWYIDASFPSRHNGTNWVYLVCYSVFEVPSRNILAFAFKMANDCGEFAFHKVDLGLHLMIKIDARHEVSSLWSVQQFLAEFAFFR